MGVVDAATRRPVYVHCGDCAHEWPAFYLPLVMDEAGMRLIDSVGQAPCPMCASKRTFMGQASAIAGVVTDE